MVVVKNLSTTVINSLSNIGGEILYNTTANRPIVNTTGGFQYFVLSDLSGAVTGLSSISATNITGTLQTAAQPNVTSLGTLTGLTSNGNVNIASADGAEVGLQLAGTLVTASATQLNYTNVTPGTAVAGKALVTDENNSIVGLSNLETDNLTVNGTLVTASAIELNYTDVTTIGTAQASKALVLDENKDIVGIHNLETDNLTVNGTLVTASAIELNYTDVTTIGTAQASKAVVLDANKDIVGLNHVSAETLTGTLQTAAQPNVTSLGTLTGLTVNGTTNLSALTVGGVPLTPYGSDGIRTRVYSTTDFNGSIVWNEISNNVNFSEYAPAGLTQNYSMEVFGYIKPQYTEDYTFTVTSNANFRMWINNELVKTGWTNGAHNSLQTGAISLTADVWYPIYIQHVQLTSTEVLTLSWTSTSQSIEIIPQARFAFDNKDVDVSMRNVHFQDKINLYDSTNSHVSSVSVTTAGDLTLSPYSDIVNIPGHNGSTTGLKLNGTLVTSSATQINYTNVTPGTASATRALVVDANKDIGSIRNVRTVGNLGINTTAADKQVEINNATGDCLRLSYNTNSGNAETYTDFLVSNTGNLTITAAGSSINLSNALNVTGATDLSSTLDVTGATTLSSTLGVTGATTLSSTLGVTGVINFNDTTDATSAAAGGSLTIAGGVGIAKKLYVGNSAFVAGALSVSAATSLADTLSVGLALTANNTLSVAGATTLSSTLGVTGATTLSSTLGVTGASTLSSTLGVTGATTLSSTLDVTGATVLSSTLDVTGASTFTGAVTMAGGFVLSNTDDATSSTAGGALTIAGGAAVAKKLFVGTDLSIGGTSTLGGTLAVTGATTLSDTLAVTGASTLSSTLAVTGATTLSSTLGVTGVINFDNTTDATSSTVGGSLTLAGGAGIAKKLFVGTNLSVGSTSIFGNKISVGTGSTPSYLVDFGESTAPPAMSINLWGGMRGISAAAGAVNYMSDASHSWWSVTGPQSGADSSNPSGTLMMNLSNTGVFGLANTTAATSSSSGAVLLAGGIASGNTTDASSSTNGGGLTLAGGAAIAKKLFVGTDLSIGGNSSLAGTLSVSSTLGVTGATTLSSTLGVTGASTLSSTLDVTGATTLSDTLAVTGASTLSSTLGVTGATTLSSTLSATGAITFSNVTDATSSTAGGAVTISGGVGIAKKLFVGTNADIGGTLGVTGNSTLSGTLGVTGATTLSDTLAVTGASTLSSTLAVTGASTLSSTLDVTGATVLSSTLDVTGASTFTGAVTMAGGFVLSNTDDATSSTAGGALTIAGGAAVAKKLFVGTNLSVGGSTTLNGNLSVTGPTLQLPTGDTAARPSAPSVGVVRYNSETSQFEGYGAGSSWGSLGGVVNVEQTTKILAETSPASGDNNLRFINNTSESMRLTSTGKLGVNTTAPSKQVEINATTGDVLRLTYNNNNGTATNYSDFSISNAGNLTILSSGLTTYIDATNHFDIAGHNGSTLGLKLNGALVTSTAEQLNYNNVTPGTAAASKTLVLDSSRDIANINNMSVSNLNTTFNDANAATVGYPINLIRTTSDTPAAGLGIGLDFYIENSANNNVSFGELEVSATTITSGSEEGQMIINLMHAGTSTAAMTLNNTTMMVTELVETSDRRVKENFTTVDHEDSFNKIMDLNVIDYNFIADSEKRTHRGLIAQELAEIIPDAVTICEKDGIEDFHAVSTKELVGYLISSLQFMNSKFDALNAKYEDLKQNVCKCNQL